MELGRACEVECKNDFSAAKWHGGWKGGRQKLKGGEIEVCRGRWANRWGFWRSVWWLCQRLQRSLGCFWRVEWAWWMGREWRKHLSEGGSDEMRKSRGGAWSTGKGRRLRERTAKEGRRTRKRMALQRLEGRRRREAEGKTFGRELDG